MAQTVSIWGVSNGVQEDLRTLMLVGIDDLIHKYGGLNKAILGLEEKYIQFKRDFDTFTRLPEVIQNGDELHYLACFWNDFYVGYILFRGMAQEVRDNQVVKMQLFEQTFQTTHLSYESLPEIVKRAYNQEFYEMVESSRTS